MSNNSTLAPSSPTDLVNANKLMDIKTPSPRRNPIPEAPMKKRTNRKEAPKYVAPDMMYGLESISCELAHEFYLQHRNHLIKINNRKDVEVFYMKTYKFWCPPHLKSSPRHTSQIMYALSNYLRVCDINKGDLYWYAYVELPRGPVNFPNQLNLVKNVTMTRGSNDKGRMLLSELNL